MGEISRSPLFFVCVCKNKKGGMADMAKSSFKIPTSLDSTYLDMEIALQSQDGVGVKPLPLKVILFYIMGVLFLVYLGLESFLSEAGFGYVVAFAFFWILLLVLLGKSDKSKRMGVMLLPTLLNYLPKASRLVTTRKGDVAAPFLQILGIEAVDENGLVHFTDGSLGYWYAVVGSASVLLFEDDRNSIIDRVENFYRKIDEHVEISFQTSKEAQRVHNQIVALDARYQNLREQGAVNDDINALVQEQYDTLTEFVGRDFSSIHQYMLIRGDNKEALMGAVNVLASEVDNSSLMIKRCMPMYRDDVYDFLRKIYRKGSGDIG